MKLLFQQRAFSWLDSYDIYDENGDALFRVVGRPSWGSCLHILNADGEHIATVRQKAAALLSTFELYAYGEYLGCIKKEMTLLAPKFTIDCSDWTVEGDWRAWNYAITSPAQGLVAVISREPFHWTDTYVIDVLDQSNVLCALMIALSIDAGKCD